MPQIILNITSDSDKIYNSSDIACYIIADSLSSTKIKEAVSTNKMVLVAGEDSLQVCKQYGLDGIIKILDEKKPVKTQLKPLREALKNKTLGVVTPVRRHEAMLVGEVEPDFIVFEKEVSVRNPDVIGWYNDLFLIPLVLSGCDKEDQSLHENVDFVIIDSKKFENFGC